MTDFFTSLVDRALDRTPVLERRQPTLFEPADDPRKRAKFEERSPLEEEEILQEGRPALAERKHSVNTSSRSPEEPRSKQAESQPVEVGPVSRGPRHDSPASPHDRITARLDPVAIATRKEPAKEVTPEEPGRGLQTRTVKEPEQVPVTPTRSVETIVERRVEREIIKERSTDQPAIKEVHTVTQINEQSKPSREKDSAQTKQPLKAEVKQLTPSIERRASERSVGEKPSPPAKQPQITRPAPRAEAKDSSEQTTAPVIHVTIGRVEVRATPPAAKKHRAAQSAGPKLSLEDYLRARVEGK